MNLGLEGRRALVGGATSGLGWAIAQTLAAEGARLLLWSRDETKLQASAERLRATTSVEVAVVAADAREPEASRAVVAAAQQAFGGVDIAVLNSGGPPAVDPLATSAEGWRESLQLLLMTPVEVATAFLPAMREQRWGRIVAVLSSGIREPMTSGGR